MRDFLENVQKKRRNKNSSPLPLKFFLNEQKLAISGLIQKQQLRAKKNVLWGKGQRLIMRNKKHIQKFIININAIFFLSLSLMSITSIC